MSQLQSEFLPYACDLDQQHVSVRTDCEGKYLNFGAGFISAITPGDDGSMGCVA